MPSFILNGVYLGSKDDLDLAKLNERKIGLVISIMSEDKLKAMDDVFGQLEAGGIAYMRFAAEDKSSQPIIQHILRTALLINEYQKVRQRNILINCAAGASRSAALVIGYLMLHYLFDFDTALSYVKHQRSIVRPNSGFCTQLKILNDMIKYVRSRPTSNKDNTVIDVYMTYLTDIRRMLPDDAAKFCNSEIEFMSSIVNSFAF